VNRVLVTGATGFIGRHALAPLGERGFELHAVTSGEPATDAQARWHRADLLDPADRARIAREAGASHLLHLAWYTQPGDYWESGHNDRWVEASLALLEEFRTAGGRRAVIAGSCAEYEWSRPRLSEATTPLRPATRYGRAKDHLRAGAEELGRREGLEVVWGRLFFLYGPGEHPQRLVPSVTRALLAGEPARTTDGSQRRDFLFAPEAADAFAALVDSEFSGAVNVASGESVSVRDVVELIGRATGRRELIELGAIPRPLDDPPELVADTSLLRERVGWRPRVGLAEGIERTVAWWRERLGA